MVGVLDGVALYHAPTHRKRESHSTKPTKVQITVQDSENPKYNYYMHLEQATRQSVFSVAWTS